MDKITLIATATFGLEALVKREVLALGFDDLNVSDGKVEFTATPEDIPRVNLWLRCADRVLVKMAEFKATTFDDLFEQTKAVAWEQWIPSDGRFPVSGKSVKSQLQSVRSNQAIVNKAVAERLQAAHATTDLPETGAEYAIQIALLKDTATLTLDTSGTGLHKRGYRIEAGEAPLKETLAAALVQLSFWNPERLLVDPMCGAGTILIEAAMIARNIAPGLQRKFASEEWTTAVASSAWEVAREEAGAAINRENELQLIGYDIDPAVIAIAEDNAYRAGVGADIEFEAKAIKDLWIDQQHGILISNPPYGLRLTSFQEVNQIYITLNKMLRKKTGWSVYILTADAHFPNYFKRGRPNRVRKLYNGSIKVNYYQYHGDKPD